MLGLIITITICLLYAFGITGSGISAIIVIAAGAWEIAAAWLYHKLGWFKFFYHGMLGWHVPDENIDHWSDGCSDHAICKYCGKDIMQDSQGNWFTKGEC